MKTQGIISFPAIVSSILLAVSCSEMFDNVREYGDAETIYAGKLDGVQSVQYGFERVEIDLMAAGRLPASQMSLGRSTKTIVECPYFEEDGHRRVIDSLASWLNITGLTRPDSYDFTIYTEDAYGNKSLPITAQVQPFTSENLKSLALTQPSVTESDVAAQLEWRVRQSNVTYTMNGYKYSYTDKDGIVHSGEDEGDMPVFLVENIEKDTDVIVSLVCDIVPNIANSRGSYTPLLDSVEWETDVVVHISADASPAIFLKEPLPDFSFDLDKQEYPIHFSWTEVTAASGYVLKLSTSSGFEDGNTISIAAGSSPEYNLSWDEVSQILGTGRKVRERELFWSVDAEGVGNVGTQTRKMNVTRSPQLIGRWTFDDPSNLLAAEAGKDLTALGARTVTATDGPSSVNGAAEISSGTYLRLRHDLPEGTSDFTISMYVNFPWRDYRPLINFNQGDGNPAEFSLSVDSALTFADLATAGRNYGVTPTLWHLITLTVSNGALTAYVDGIQVLSASSAAERFMLNEPYMTLFADGGGTNSKKTCIADLAMWDMPLEVDEILDYYKLKRVDYLECSINNWSGEAITSPENVITGSPSGSAYYGQCDPLMVTIDMGRRRNLGFVAVCGYIWAGDDAKYFDLSLSDSGASYAQYTSIGTIATPAAGWRNGTFYTIDLSDIEVSGRYLKVTGREVWNEDNHYILMSEVIMFEKAE